MVDILQSDVVVPHQQGRAHAEASPGTFPDGPSSVRDASSERATRDLDGPLNNGVGDRRSTGASRSRVGAADGTRGVVRTETILCPSSPAGGPAADRCGAPIP